MAIEAPDLTLVSGDLTAAADAMSRATLRVVKQNLAWAFGYNVTLIPLAAMVLSSLSVVGNALRLRRFAAAS